MYSCNVIWLFQERQFRLRELFLAESTRAVKCCCSLAFCGVPVLDYQKLDAMAQQWPFSERRLKNILQKVVEETQRAREGVYTWLMVDDVRWSLLNSKIKSIDAGGKGHALFTTEGH